MIIITGKQGQLGNSLILYATFIAFALEHQIQLLNPSFYRYNKYFKFRSRNSGFFIKYFFILLYYFTRILHKLKSRHVIYLDWNDQINLDEQAKLFRGIKFVQGWNFRGNKVLTKHKEQIQKVFEPAPIYKNKLKEFIEKNLNQSDKIKVGLHIRRGDYSWFENGKYFFSIEEYDQILKRVKKLFPEKDVYFLICSNEQVSNKKFSTGNIVYGPGHELLDLYSFTYCDYIVGPPSTYTMWASFYGNVPLYMIHDIGKDFNLSDFKVQTGF